MDIKWIFNAALPFNKLQIQKFYHNQLRFNGIYSKDIFPKKIKNEVYVTNFNEYADVGTHWS